MEPDDELRGLTVGITADRRGDEQALMFTRLGLSVLRGPAIATVQVSDDARLRAVTEALVAEPPDYLVANTGLGMRNWLALAESWGLAQGLLTALGTTRIVARGPKAAGAVRIAGLGVWWRSPDEQVASVGRRLVEEGVSGARVAVQLHGDHRSGLSGVLGDAGAEVIELPVYRWTAPADAAPALGLIERCCSGGVDAVTFTAGPAVRNLFEIADAEGRADALLDALNGPVLVACVGPVCAGVAAEEGLTDVVVPEHWRLGSLVRLVADELRARGPAGRAPGT